MAVAVDIAAVRKHTNEKTDEHFTDEVIGIYLDELGGVDAAAAAVWLDKAAMYADLVDSIEAGVNHQFSQLHRHALRMAEIFNARATGIGIGAGGLGGGGGVRVSSIERGNP